MNLRDRLDRLTSITKAGGDQKEEVIGELRQRIDRLLEPKKASSAQGGRVPIEELVQGEVLSTPDGEIFRAAETFPQDLRLGEMTLAEIVDLPTYPAHLLTGDERLRELAFREALFLDTETTGIAGGTGTVAFMVGLGWFDEGGFTVEQYFMRDYPEERACLGRLKERLEAFRFLVTFNGKQYDVPLLETRFILSRLPSGIREMPNLDLLFPARKIWKGAFENCRLVTLESQLLGVDRQDDVPSEMIPWLYFDYVRTGDGRKIDRVFYHNRMDILSMAGLAGRMHLIYHDPEAARPRKGIEHFALGRLYWDHGSPEKAIACFETALRRCDDALAWEVTRWLALACKKTGQGDRARVLWEEMVTWPSRRDAMPCVELAKYHEHRTRDLCQALFWTGEALQRTPSHEPADLEALLHRKGRLEAKTKPKGT
jgi:uncharacterized protein